MGRRRRSRLRFAFLVRRPLFVAGSLALAAVVACALGADLLASERPLAYRLDGETRWFPDAWENDALDNRQALARLGAQGDGWVLTPPVPYGPEQCKVEGRIAWLSPPGPGHLLGTDGTGRDVLARIIHGARSALLVGFVAVGIQLLVGMLLGALAGYFGGVVDRGVLRVIETFSAFPAFFLILALQGLLGSSGALQLALVIGLVRWTEVARLARGEVLRISGEGFVTAAHALGLSHLTVLRRHVIPNALGPVLVSAAFGIGGAILIESTLSFLGFGIDAPSWGQLLTDALDADGAGWLMIYPGIALFVTLVSVNLVGEGLREALDRGR